MLFASYQFAERYAGGDNMQWWMAIICGVVYAMVELARVPLAVCAATHRRWYARWLAIFVLMFAVVITTKSLSQIGEQMFSQRLVEVHKAQTALEIAEANNRGAIEDDAAKRERIEALDSEIEKLLTQMKEFGKPPEPKTICTTQQSRRGLIRNCKVVTTPWAGETIQKALTDAFAPDAMPWMVRPISPPRSVTTPRSQLPRRGATIRPLSCTASCIRLRACCIARRSRK